VTRHVTQKKWNFTPSTFVLIASLIFIIGYAAGTRNDQIIGTLGPAVGLKVESGTLDLASVQTTYRQLKLHFDGELDTQALVNGASRGVVSAAGDDYTVYMDREEADEFNKDLNGDIGGGIGAEIGNRNQRPTIIRALSGTPAERAGVQAGDIILGVNDQPTDGWSVSDTVSKIRGDIGTTVKLTVLRNGEAKEMTITREQITSPSVEHKIQDNIGILTIRRFDDSTTDAARVAAKEFTQAKVKGVVLDMRGNGGGLLSAAQEISGLWLRDKVVVSERAHGQVIDELKSGGNPLLEGIKTVVLINSGSASASEIVAGALKEHGVATLIGEKTFGKGSVQRLINLNDGSVLKVTVARWYTPKGNNINKEGVAPHEKVELTADDANAGRDPQLEAGIEKLR